VSKSLRGLSVLWVLRHPPLLRLWLAQIIYLSVQFTASYAMIVLITNETHSATLVGLVIIALSLPLVLFGAPAGALVDRMNRRTVLWISNVVRALATALFVIALVLNPHAYFSIYVLAFFFSLVGLFFSPAEGAMIPYLVGESELLPALSLYNLTLNASQAVGLLLLGPLALNLVPSITLPFGGNPSFSPPETLFAGLTVLYLIAAALTASLPGERKRSLPPSRTFLAEALAAQAMGAAQPAPPQRGGLAGLWQRLRADVQEGWSLVRRDKLLFDGLWQSCFGGLVMLTVAELATTFVQRLLDLPVSDTALVFAPAGVGLVLGSLLVPWIAEHLGHTRTIVLGMVGSAIGIGLLPLVQGLEHSSSTSWHTEPLFLLALSGLTALAGASLDCIIVPAQTRMQERSPDELRGRVLAFYQVLFNGGAIPVILFMGAFTDLLGITPVIVMLACLSLGAAVVTSARVLLSNRHNAQQPPDAEESQPQYSEELAR